MQISECRPDCKSSFRLQISQNAATDCRLGAHEVLADCRLQIAEPARADCSRKSQSRSRLQIADCSDHLPCLYARKSQSENRLQIADFRRLPWQRLSFKFAICKQNADSSLQAPLGLCNLQSFVRLQIPDCR